MTSSAKDQRLNAAMHHEMPEGTVKIVRLEGLHPIKPHAPPLKTDPVKHLGFDPY
jgi:hypothetical protein